MNLLPMSPETARKNMTLAYEAAERLDKEIKRLTAEADNARNSATSWGNAAMWLEDPTDPKSAECSAWFIEDAIQSRPIYWMPDPRG